MKKFSEHNKESKDSKDQTTKSSLDKISEKLDQTISNKNNSLIQEFTNKYDNIVTNVEKSNETVKQFESIVDKLDQFVKKDDLSEFLFSQVVVLKQQFEDYKKSVEDLNNTKSQEITNEVKKVISKANLVIEKVDQESKIYKKKYFEDTILNEQKFKNIDHKFDTLEYQNIIEKIESFNKNLLSLQDVVNTSIPIQNKKVDNFIIENQEAIKDVNSTSDKLKLAVTEILQDFENKLENLTETFLTNDKLDTTNKKYNKKIVEVHNEVERIRKDFTKVNNHFTLSKDQFKDIGDKLNSVTENIFGVEQRLKAERDKQNYRIVEADTKLDKKIEDVKNESLLKINSLKENFSTLRENFSSDITNVGKDFGKEIVETKKQFDNKLKNVKIDQNQIDAKFKKKLNEELKLVTNDIKSTNTKIDKHLSKYKLLEDKQKSIITDVKNVFKDKKFTDLNKKITFIEETLEKFNEKTLLTEDLINNPSETNKDPLTPLNQNFVTFDDLKKHYSLFINRVQQQLMSLGGGGAVRLDQLDDVNIRNSAGAIKATNGQSLVFITASGKFEPITVGAAAGEVSSVGAASGSISNAQILQFVTSAVKANIGNLSLSGNIIPDADNVHSLGTESLRFKDLFLSGNTFKLGGLTLKDEGGTLGVTDSADQKILDASASTPSLSSADLTIANVAGYAANLDTRFTGANIGGALTGGTDIEITASGTVNYTGSGGGGSGVSSIGGATGAVGNVILGRMVNDSGALTISNIAGYHANLESELTTANVSELTNLYYSNGRANSTLVANLSYDNVNYLSNIVGSDTQIQLTSEKNFIRFYAANQSAFPPAGDYHGAIMHSHADAAMYYAHGGVWNKMIDTASLAANIDSRLTIANVSGYHANLESELTTANVGEVTNLYFTDARAKDALAANIDTRLTIANVAGYAANLDTRLTIANVAGYHANLESELTTANVSAVGAADGELYFSNARANLAIAANVHHSMKQHMVMALSAEGGDLATSANVLIFRAPEAMSLYKIPRISCNNKPTGAAIQVGIQKNGSDIFSTNLTIDANETSSKTAGTDAVLTSTPYLIADDDEITVDINQVGSTDPGSGLKLTLYYTVTE